MTPTRFQTCLEFLRLSQRGLAMTLGCSIRLPGAWATGTQSIPPKVGVWLESCVAVRRAHPDPKPPRNWRRNTWT